MTTAENGYGFSHRLRILVAAWLGSADGRDHPHRRHIERLPGMFALATEMVLDARLTRPDRSLLLAAIVYVVNPGDFLPEGVVGAPGYADDTVVLALVLSRVLRGAPADLVVDAPLDEIGETAAAGPQILGRPLWERVTGWLEACAGDDDVSGASSPAR